MVLVLQKTEKNQLKERIEKLRKEMVFLSDQFGMKHPLVQQCSERLDSVLLEYYQTYGKYKL